MDRQNLLILALGLLAVAGIIVSVSGWMLFSHLRKQGDAPAEAEAPEGDETEGDLA